MRFDIRFEISQRVPHRVVTDVVGGGTQLVSGLMSELADIARQVVGVFVEARCRAFESARCRAASRIDGIDRVVPDR